MSFWGYLGGSFFAGDLRIASTHFELLKDAAIGIDWKPEIVVTPRANSIKTANSDKPTPTWFCGTITAVVLSMRGESDSSSEQFVLNADALHVGQSSDHNGSIGTMQAVRQRDFGYRTEIGHCLNDDCIVA